MRGIAEDGWLVYYDDRRDPPDSSMIGELCVVGLSDGRTLIKYLYPGTETGLFNLESTTEATLRNVFDRVGPPPSRRSSRGLPRAG